MSKSRLNASADRLRGPGFWESIKEVFMGVRRPFDCIQVEVSSRCPGRCNYCPHTILQPQWQSRDMNADTFERLWPLMRQTTRVHLQGWGEPLLNPLFFDMVALARKAGAQVSTTTCGLLMTPQTAQKIVESGMDIVAFSLTGTDTAGNAARKGVDFEKVCESIERLQTIRKKRVGVHLEIHFAYLMLASNMDAVGGLPDLMKRLGVHATVVSTLDYIPAPNLAAEAFLPDETEKIARAASLLHKAAAEARELGLEFHYELPRKDAPGNICRENIQSSLFVSADGSVSPCVYANVPADRVDPDRRIFGNVNEQDPLEIWNSEAYRNFRNDLAQGLPPPPCRPCPKRVTR